MLKYGYVRPWTDMDNMKKKKKKKKDLLFNYFL